MLYARNRTVPALVATVFAITLSLRGAASEYVWPLRVERVVTSSFGEFREGHVHAGLDLSTGGREGLPVYSAGDGYVERLRCSPFGYGKAVYVRLDDGSTAVYAHLSDYAPELRRRVEKAQMNRLSYEVDLWLTAGEIPVQVGDELARSGSTGTGAPHLHFEIRASDGCPVNPYEYYSKVPDSVTPEFGDIAVVPVDAESRVDGLPVPAVIPVKRDSAAGQYVPSRMVHARGRVGIAVEARDRGSVGSYRRGIHLLESNVDGTPMFSVRNDRFCYERGRQVYLTYVFSLLRRTGRRFLKAYRDTGNTLLSYREFTGGAGYLEIDDEPRTVLVKAVDYKGNTSEMKVHILPESEHTRGAEDYAGEDGKAADGLNGLFTCAADFWPDAVIFRISSEGLALFGTPEARIMTVDGEMISLAVRPVLSDKYIASTPLSESMDGPWTLRVSVPGAAGKQLVDEWSYNLTRIEPEDGGNLTSRDEMATAHFPADGLYSPLYGRAGVDDTLYGNGGHGKLVGKAYTFGPADEPLAARCEINIQCPAGESLDGLGVYKLSDNGTPWFMGEYGVPAMTYELGTFALVRDNTRPEVNIKSPAPGRRAGRYPLRVEVALNDAPAGIDLGSVRTELDGHPIICEYHPPSRSLKYDGRSPLESGTHTFRITVRDNIGNETVREVSFTVQKNAP